MKYKIYDVNLVEQYCESVIGYISIDKEFSDDQLIDKFKKLNLLNNNLIYNIKYNFNNIYIYYENILMYLLVSEC